MNPHELKKITEMTRYLAEIRRLQETLREVNRIQRLRNVLKWIYENRKSLENLTDQDRDRLRSALDEDQTWKNSKQDKTFPFYNQILQTPFQSWNEFLVRELGLPAERADYDAQEWEKVLRRLMGEG